MGDNRITLTADEGYIYTDGEVYGTVIYLANGVNVDNFKQITMEEYNEIVSINDSELTIHK